MADDEKSIRRQEAAIGWLIAVMLAFLAAGVLGVIVPILARGGIEQWQLLLHGQFQDAACQPMADAALWSVDVDGESAP